MTSATPPSLTKGTASVLTIKILNRASFMVQPSCKGGSTARSFFSLLSYHAKQNVVGQGITNPLVFVILSVSEESPCPSLEILRCAQDDKRIPFFSPTTSSVRYNESHTVE